MTENIKKHLKENKEIYIIGVIFAVLIFFSGPANNLISDSAYYADIAHNLLNNHALMHNFEMESGGISYGFPLILSLFMFIFKTEYILFYLAAASFSLVTANYFLVKKITKDKKTSVLSTLLLIFTSEILFNSRLLINDVLFVILTLTSFLIYFSYLDERNRRKKLSLSVLLGFAIAYGFTIRPSFVFVLVSIMIFGIINDMRNKRNMIYYLVPALIVISSFFAGSAIFNSGDEYAGKIYTDSLKDYEMSGHISLNIERLKDGEVLESTIDIDKTVPPQIINIIRMLLIFLVYIGPFLLLGIFYSMYKEAINNNIKKTIKKPEFLLYLWAGIYILFHLYWPNALAVRYMLPLFPVFALFFAKMAVDNWEKYKKIIFVLIVFHLIFSGLVIIHESQTRWDRYDTDVLKDGGEWIKDNSVSGDVIYLFNEDTTSAIIYYGERKVFFSKEYDSKNIQKSGSRYVLSSDIGGKTDIFIDIASEDVYELCERFEDDKCYLNIYSKEC
ncbi:MAG: phospholipid carrier-dependent glycosyltransferase [Nanohaloarchaea archaeon]|nr:phospholipid carrier-dependent glycosyltransferase [Candidatus Nanohaloarchaea archaeon]